MLLCWGSRIARADGGHCSHHSHQESTGPGLMWLTIPTTETSRTPSQLSAVCITPHSSLSGHVLTPPAFSAGSLLTYSLLPWLMVLEAGKCKVTVLAGCQLPQQKASCCSNLQRKAGEEVGRYRRQDSDARLEKHCLIPGT